MRQYCSSKVLGALIVGLFLLGLPCAEAQLGIGIGVGRGGYWGPGYGSFFGLGIGLSPRLGRQSDTRSYRPGSLEGTVNLCPVEQKLKNCSVPYEVLQSIVVSALPYGSNQWISTRLDAQGEYRLQLSPGRYLVRVDTPHTVKSMRVPSEVNIEAGRTRHLNLNLNGV
jgi:hypothetical protein